MQNAKTVSLTFTSKTTNAWPILKTAQQIVGYVYY